MRILNKTDVTQSIRLVDAEGYVDTLQLQPGRPCNLPEGWELDPSMYTEYVMILRTDPPMTPPQPAPQFEVPPSTTPDTPAVSEE